MADKQHVYREVQHILGGAMVTVRVWGDDEFATVAVTTRDRRAVKTDLDVPLSAGEARKLARHLDAAADALEREADRA